MGQPSLRKLLRSVTARELTFWQAYEAVEGPIGGGGQNRRVAGYQTEELPEIEEETPEQRDERVAAKVMQMFHHPELAK